MNRYYQFTSATYHLDDHEIFEEDWESKDLIKTHLLPDQVPGLKSAPVVYLLRDGRDSVVSLAHHRCDLIQPNSDLLANMAEAIISAGGSYFGGWSRHVREWVPRADLVIRFEDLVKDPLGALDKVAELLHLPPRPDLPPPTIKDLKENPQLYAPLDRISQTKAEQPGFTEKFFRKGKVKGWREEMPADLEELFFALHGEELVRHGYEDASRLRGSLSVGIEVSKLNDPHKDGCRRYVELLVSGLSRVSSSEGWKFYLVTRKGEGVPLDAGYKTGAGSGVVPSSFRERFYRLIYGGLKWLRHKSWRGPIKEWLRGWEQKVWGWLLESSVILKALSVFHMPLPNVALRCGWLDSLTWVTTVHDVSHLDCPESQDEVNNRPLEQGLQVAMDRNSFWICDSDFTKKRFEHHFPKIPAERVHEIPLASAPLFHPEASMPQLLTKTVRPGRYFLCVGTLEPRKNLGLAVAAFESSGLDSSDWKCLVVGRWGWKENQVFGQSELPKGIVLTGPLNDEEVAGLMAHACALLFPSRYEGFGLPALEALSCGTPVCCLKGTPMEQIVGSAGLVLPDDPDAWAQALRRLADPATALRQSLASQALLQAGKFSVDQMVERTLAVYRLAHCDFLIRKAQRKYILQRPGLKSAK